MDKPFSVLCEEFRQELADLINNSGLPPFVIESVLKNYTNEVSSFARNQYNVDKAKYECFLSEKEKKEEEIKNEKK